ncbi:hypothetical protein SEPCBS119000_002419 [Sporothrix epigloea]|uniref:BAH domain-containing protein n=1 Tax=Sporothrix epigloea TaxID=1892477 RepID=A0ABP0DG42_9PEZI
MKRPRSDTVVDDNQAECPFTVQVLGPRDKALQTKSKKRRKRKSSGSDTQNPSGDDDGNHKLLYQCTPFEPRGEFVTHGNMDVHYVVEPADQWASLTRYNSFVLNGLKFYCEGFISVANDASLEHQKSGTSAGSAAYGAAGLASAGAFGARGDDGKRSDDDWIARVVEIRASDEHHVYARVFWMYWPDELPPGTRCGKRVVHGWQPYHGASELIASNHMDVINVVSVTSMASVNQLNEDKDDDVQSGLYWRQALDVRTMELSSIEGICCCNQPGNPDKMLIGCSYGSCAKWIHEECLKHYALMRVYERLGQSRPHITTEFYLPDRPLGGSVKSEQGQEDVKEPMSPQASEVAVSPQRTRNAKLDTNEFHGASDHDQSDSGSVDTKYPLRTINGSSQRHQRKHLARRDSVHLKQQGPPDPEAGADLLAKSATGPKTPRSPTVTRGAADVSVNKSRKSSGGAVKGVAIPSVRTPAGRTFPTLRSYGNKKKPYDKLFEAELLLTPLHPSAPTMIEIRDLRRKVTGGEKVWMEPAECPVCGSAIR